MCVCVVCVYVCVFLCVCVPVYVCAPVCLCVCVNTASSNLVLYIEKQNTFCSIYFTQQQSHGVPISSITSTYR